MFVLQRYQINCKYMKKVLKFHKKALTIFVNACFSESDSGAIRTLDPQLRRLLLYPTELRNHNVYFQTITPLIKLHFLLNGGTLSGTMLIFYA